MRRFAIHAMACVGLIQQPLEGDSTLHKGLLALCYCHAPPSSTCLPRLLLMPLLTPRIHACAHARVPPGRFGADRFAVRSLPVSLDDCKRQVTA